MIKILPFDVYDKEITIVVDGIKVCIDNDDVDHEQAAKLACKIIRLLKVDEKK